MISKASYFSISKPLIIENMRRFWAIPVLSFLVYFLSGVFPILMSYSHLNNLSGYIEMSLSNQQPFFLFAHLIFPIVAAVVIFRYLQGVSSVSVIHSMPFTRAKLYNSGFMTGLILIIAPILANGLILLAISKPVYRAYSTEAGMMLNEVNSFARADIVTWIWVSIIIVVLTYAVSVFAGIVTGNALMHFAAAIWFNFLIPALYGVFIAYFSHFLYGFDTSQNWVEFGMRISPFLNVLQDDGHFGLYSVIYYIVSFLILYAITGLLYHKRKLEHATDSLAFGFMEPIICYLIAFLGMTLLGFYFDVLGESELYMYAGLAAGTVIFFIIGQMIVKKTPRIYNLKSLKSFGIYSLIAVLFILSLNIDVTGFERRVPDPEGVDSFTLSDSFGRNQNYYYYGNGISYSIYKGDEEGLRFKDPANTAAVAKLHRMLIENKNRLQDMTNVFSSSILVSYNPDSVFPLTRRYMLDYETFRDSADFKQLYESSEYRNYYAPSNLNYEGLIDIYLNSDIPNQEPVEIKNKKDMDEFLACLDQDFKAQRFEDITSLRHGYANANINFTYKNVHSDTPERLLNNGITYQITESYVTTIKWLEDHGYGDRFKHRISDIDYIELYHYVDNGSDKTPSVAEYTVEDKALQAKSLKVTDPDEIQKLLDSYETQTINYSDYYYGSIFYKWNSEYDQKYMDKIAYDKEFGGSGVPYETAPASMATIQIYFNAGNIPDYVLDYFK